VSDHLIQVNSNLAVVQDHSRQFARKFNAAESGANTDSIRRKTGLWVLAFD
jgi:hypothetical protein